MEDYRLAYKYEEQMEHRKWMKEIPFLNFPADWQVQITPPFAGAVVRFRIKSKEAEISVYLDCYDRLGCVGKPYWEICPHDGDTYRCYLNETEDLIKNIQYAIDNYGG